MMSKNRELVRRWLKSKGRLDIFEHLEMYNELITRWKEIYNIVGGDEDKRWRLIGESLLAMDLIDGGDIIDVGSGGGIPAIPLAIAIDYNSITMVEPNERKAFILEDIVNKLGLLNVSIFSSQIEEIRMYMKYNIITIRGISITRRLLNLLMKILKEDGRCIIYTGQLSDRVRIFLERRGWRFYNKNHTISGFRGLIYLSRG